MQNDLTIVVPTHNRHQYLDQSLPYLDTFGVSILVIDSSRRPNENIHRYNNVEYVYCPGLSIVEKLVKYIAERVRTPYMLMNADDIFPLRSTVAECVEFLKANQDYSVAQGVQAFLTEDRLYIPKPDEYLFKATLDSPSARILEYLRCYSYIYYSVHKVDCQLSFLRRIPAGLKNWALLEFYGCMMMLIHGKVEKVNSLFHINDRRAVGNYDDYSDSESSWGAWTWFDLLSEMDAFKQGVVEYLCEQESLVPLVAKKTVDGALGMLMLERLEVITPPLWFETQKEERAKRCHHKTLADRLRNEWTAFRHKTFAKKEKERIKENKKIMEREADSVVFQKALERSSEEARRDFKAIIDFLKLDFTYDI